MLRFLTTKAVCDRAASGMAIHDAVVSVLNDMAMSVGNDVGIIAIDHHGRLGIEHLTATMPHAFAIGSEEVVARLRA